MKKEATLHDHLERRCPMLGNPVLFSYCRTLEGDTSCRKIFDCWWEEFDVTSFIRETFGEETVAKILAPRKPKVLSLLDMIEQARHGQKSSSEDDEG